MLCGHWQFAAGALDTVCSQPTSSDDVQAVTNFARQSSSADDSSAFLSANSSSFDQAAAMLQDVADSSLSALVAVNESVADSSCTFNQQDIMSVSQSCRSEARPPKYGQFAELESANQPEQVRLSRPPYEQADMFFGAAVPVAPCFQSEKYDWGYAVTQPCSHAAETDDSDEFMASMALILGQVGTCSSLAFWILMALRKVCCVCVQGELTSGGCNSLTDDLLASFPW